MTIEILLANEIHYQFTDIGMSNYYLYENMQPISITAEREHEICMMYFDGSKCKHGCGVGVVFKSLEGNMRSLSFRFTWICINNVFEYETHYLGLFKAINMVIRCLIFHGDSKLVIKQVKDKIGAKHHYLKTYKNRV